MNPIFQQIIIQTIKSRNGKENIPAPSPYRKAKEFKRLKRSLLRLLRSTILISLGILSAGCGLESFLLPNDFIDGGVTGISLLISEATGFSLPVLILLINIPFIYLGYTQVGKTFAIKSAIAITSL